MAIYLSLGKYSKTCVKRPLSKDNKLVFKTNYCLMQVKIIAECSKGSILQYFQPSLSYQLSIRSLFCLFLVTVSHRFFCINLLFSVRTPGYDNKKVLTCNNIFNLSRGAVAVLDTAPAVPPETRWRHHIPVCISFSVKSSGTIVLSPISIIYRGKKKHSNSRIHGTEALFRNSTEMIFFFLKQN